MRPGLLCVCGSMLKIQILGTVIKKRVICGINSELQLAALIVYSPATASCSSPLQICVSHQIPVTHEETLPLFFKNMYF